MDAPFRSRAMMHLGVQATCGSRLSENALNGRVVESEMRFSHGCDIIK